MEIFFSFIVVAVVVGGGKNISLLHSKLSKLTRISHWFDVRMRYSRVRDTRRMTIAVEFNVSAFVADLIRNKQHWTNTIQRTNNALFWVCYLIAIIWRWEHCDELIVEAGVNFVAVVFHFVRTNQQFEIVLVEKAFTHVWSVAHRYAALHTQVKIERTLKIERKETKVIKWKYFGWYTTHDTRRSRITP